MLQLLGVQQSMSSIRQRLLTFSIVRKGMGVSDDPFSALAPFINPIANDFENREFIGVDFQTELKKRYGIALSRDVTAVFVDRLVALKYIKKDGDKLVWCRVSTVEQDMSDDGNDRLDQIVTLAEEFYRSKKDLVSEDFSEELFLEALIAVLLDQNTALKSAVEAIESNSNTQNNYSQNRTRSRHEYYASEFIAWTNRNKKEVFGWLAELSATALVTEALIEVRTPTESNYISFDITTYLDTPFLMEVLGCCGAALKGDSLLLVETLKKQHVSVSVLSISVEELVRNLSAVLRVQASQRVGPTAKALLYQEVTESYLKDVISQPSYYIEKLGIRIIDVKTSPNLEFDEYFSEDDSRNFYAMILSLHDRDEPRQHDVSLITWVMQRRKNHTSSDILRTKHLLITRNDPLVQLGVRVARERRGYQRKSWGPAVSARELAGVLWTIVGQEERAEISKRQLILSCDRARASAPQIINSMLETLRGLDPNNADLLWASVQRPAYLSIALDAAALSGATNDKETASIILKKVQEDLIAEERSKTAVKMKKIREQSDAQTQMSNLVVESLEKENLQLKENNEALLHQFHEISKAEWSRAKKKAEVTSLILKAIFHIAIISAFIGCGYISVDSVQISPLWVILIVAVVGIFTYYFSHNTIFAIIDNYVEKLYLKQYFTSLRSLVGNDVDNVKIDEPLLTTKN